MSDKEREVAKKLVAMAREVANEQPKSRKRRRKAFIKKYPLKKASRRVRLTARERRSVPMQGWDVILRGKVIDTVFYQKGIDAEEVRRGLINHDNYHPNIRVRKASRERQATTNEDVIRMFLEDSFPKNKRPVWGTKNLKITKMGPDWGLVNYSTPLLIRKSSGKLLFNAKKYSTTTSTIQKKIRAIMRSLGLRAVEVDDESKMAAVGSHMEGKKRDMPKKANAETKLTPHPSEFLRSASSHRRRVAKLDNYDILACMCREGTCWYETQTPDGDTWNTVILEDGTMNHEHFLPRPVRQAIHKDYVIQSGLKKAETVQMICLECGHRFKKTIGPKTFEVRCPKCKGYDTDVE
jgi:hypothetical protein